VALESPRPESGTPHPGLTVPLSSRDTPTGSPSMRAGPGLLPQLQFPQLPSAPAPATRFAKSASFHSNHPLREAAGHTPGVIDQFSPAISPASASSAMGNRLEALRSGRYASPQYRALLDCPSGFPPHLMSPSGRSRARKQSVPHPSTVPPPVSPSHSQSQSCCPIYPTHASVQSRPPHDKERIRPTASVTELPLETVAVALTDLSENEALAGQERVIPTVWAAQFSSTMLPDTKTTHLSPVTSPVRRSTLLSPSSTPNRSPVSSPSRRSTTLLETTFAQLQSSGSTHRTHTPTHRRPNGSSMRQLKESSSPPS